MSDRPAGRATGRARGRALETQVTEIAGGSPDRPRTDSPETGLAARGRGNYVLIRTRPKDMGPDDHIGKDGTNIDLFANYFEINTPKGSTVHDYHVSFEPEVESINVRRRLVLKNRNLFADAYLFDGMSNLKSSTELAVTDGENLTVVPTVTTVRGPDGQDVDVTNTVTFKAVGTVSWGSFEMLRLYNTQMRRNMRHLGWLQVFRDYYNPHQTIALNNYRLNIWCGISTAINEYNKGMLMVCDTISKVIRQETAFDRLVALGGSSGFQENARKELTGSIVMTQYNNKSYRIDDIDFSKNPRQTFERRGVPISVADYLREQHQIVVQDMGQPLLVVMPSRREERSAEQAGRPPPGPCYLVPELCIMTGLSDAQRDNFNLKKLLTQTTQLNPTARFKALQAFQSQLRGNANVVEEMGRWGLTFEPGLLSVTGRILSGEDILVGRGKLVTHDSTKGNFTPVIRDNLMFAPKNFASWTIICTQKDKETTNQFADMIDRVSGSLGLIVPTPAIVFIENDRTNTYIQALQSVESAMVVCMLPNNNKERYDAIKKLCCCERALPSQVVVVRTLAKKEMMMSVCTKVAVQMTCKMGGEPWAVVIPPKKLMVIGCDTYHDGALKGKSVGGFVATTNDSLTSHFSRIAYHSNRDEMSTNFAAHFRESLNAYKRKNGDLPLKIVIYRDGVGDGMLNHVYEVEVKAVIEEAEKIYAGKNMPHIAFIVVTKRISTRFFWKRMLGGHKKLDNPPPGTVVDRDVTRPERYEFYLISQSTKQGTVAPTSYNIIYNTTKFHPGNFQTLTYKLCHLYYNWMGMIRVPSVCQYAHKLAFLTGTALHREPNHGLSDQLFYL